MIPAAVARVFALGPAATVEPIGDGHIHRTWRRRGAGDDVVVQRINTAVFADPAACEDNLDRIDRHLAGTGLVPPFLRTVDGRIHWVDAGGVPWRVSRFADATVGGTVVADAAQAHDAARLFGRYVAALSTLPGGPLADTIPRFHDLARRVEQLRSAATLDRCGRREGCRGEISRADVLVAEVASRLERIGDLPVRSVHNDAKVANVRFDARTNAAAVVVDLDTTMRGTVLADVGELLRTATVPVREDAADEGAVRIDPERVAGVLDGFALGSEAVLTGAERRALGAGGPFLAVENAVRFLADHLDGDRYFGAAYPDHNLVRARAQLAVTEGLLVVT